MTEPEFDVVVVGGGPAGSAAATHLAQRGRRVLLLEKASLPREKLCGEFLSTEVAELCGRLEVLPALHEAGARPIRRLILTDPHGAEFRADLPGTAMALSRHALDHLLFRHAGACGAATADGEAVTSIEGDLAGGFVVETTRRRTATRVVVGAYGRRTLLDRRLERDSLGRRSPFVGFKARYRGWIRDKAIELHTFPGGYCGLVGDEEGTVNVCWLAHADRLKKDGGTPEMMIEGTLSGNPALRHRFDELERIGGFLAVGQLFFVAKERFAGDVCMIGDAAGMIAPLCGDGMGMALHSAELAADIIDDALVKGGSLEGIRRRYPAAWRRNFSTRMRLGRWLNAALTHEIGSGAAVAAARLFPGAAGAVITATRG